MAFTSEPMLHWCQPVQFVSMLLGARITAFLPVEHYWNPNGKHQSSLWSTVSASLHNKLVILFLSFLIPQVLPKLSLSILSEVENLLGNKPINKKDFRSWDQQCCTRSSVILLKEKLKSLADDVRWDNVSLLSLNQSALWITFVCQANFS